MEPTMLTLLTWCARVAYIVGIMAAAVLGEFEVVILLAVLHQRGHAYGAVIRDEIERRSGRAPSRGAVYVTLDRLESKGCLASTVGESTPDRGGRPRRFYQVTPRGLRALRRALAAVDQMRSGLEPVLENA
jgi:DNA-binding PadR family transcriptional regulator